MNGHKFDALTRELGIGLSRRSVLRGLVGSMALTVGASISPGVHPGHSVRAADLNELWKLIRQLAEATKEICKHKSFGYQALATPARQAVRVLTIGDLTIAAGLSIQLGLHLESLNAAIKQ